jgi:class 3 adenylate cyclase/formylglycine-generating enzyme required for sulfatase activity/predicted esterase
MRRVVTKDDGSTHPTTSILKAFLFTDLVGSTDLKRRLGDAACAEVISRHDGLFHRTLSQFGGGGDKDMGDGFLAVFDVPSDAVRCALAFQRGLAELEAPEPLKVRIGIHTGETVLVAAEETPGDSGGAEGKLIGLAVDTAARVMSLALGGQILLTRGAFDSARQLLPNAPDGSALRWLAHGPFYFKGLDDTVDVFEVGIEGFSPLAAPPDSEKARRALAPGVEETLGWRPAAGLAIPRREHWRLSEPLGEGGYGEVWLAENAKTRDKRVFKFCFDFERVRGLKREVVLFRLLKESLGNRHDIVQIVDWEFERPPYFLESEYTEAGDLTAWAEAQGGIGAVGLETRIELIAQTAAALGAAHGAGVLHKDVKPSNILIAKGGETGKPMARLTDFGIGLVTSREALQAKGVTVAGLTETLLSSSSTSKTTGTRLYMAPEIIEGKAASELSDVYALGVVLYQMVIGDFSRAVAPGWERDVEDGLLREDIGACVDGIPERRLGSAAELAERLQNLEARRSGRARERRARRVRKAMVVALAVALLGAIVAVAIVGPLRRNAARTRARTEDVPRVIQLIEQEQYRAAFDLAKEAEVVLPDDPILAPLWDEMSNVLLIETEPEGAEVYYREVGDAQEEWGHAGATPIREFRLPRGGYHWKVEKPGYETRMFLHAISYSQPDGSFQGTSFFADPVERNKIRLRLDKEGTIPPGMIVVDGGGHSPSNVNADAGSESPGRFFIDRTEVTNREFKEFVDDGAYAKRDFWKHEFVKDGKLLDWEEAMAQFVDATGRPGPSTWESGSYLEGTAEHPVSGVSWYEAAAYAESRGKVLPTVGHWTWACLPVDEYVYPLTPFIVPWSNFGGEGLAAVGSYPAIGLFGASDMAGNVSEWCRNSAGGGHATRGGAWKEPTYAFSDPASQLSFARFETLGFRCMRSAGPEPEYLAGPIAASKLDLASGEPISDDAFAVYQRLASYGDVPLNPYIEQEGERGESSIHEIVTIDAGYEGERLILHLYLPLAAAPPHRAVVYFPGMDALQQETFIEAYWERFDYIPKSGRVLVRPIFLETYNRGGGGAPVQSDTLIKWTKELGRCIDYLEARRDIDSDRVAYMGLSYGANIGPSILPLEPRVRVAIFIAGGPSRLTLAPFLPRMTVPVLMLNGQYDHAFPVQTAQKPFFELLGAPPEHKRHVIFEGVGHLPLPRAKMIAEILEWLDRYQSAEAP